MFVRLLFESFRRQRRRKVLALLAIALGMSISTAMIAVATDVGDKVNQELRTYGANLSLTPMDDTLNVNLGGVDMKPASQGSFIQEADLPKMKDTFWGHNIIGFAPFLSQRQTFAADGQPLTAELIGTYFAQELQSGKGKFTTGVRSVNKFWKVEGDWPADDSSDVLAGSSLARQYGLRAGSMMEAGGKNMRVVGVVSTGGTEDSAIVAPLHLVQQIMGRPGLIDRALVSALTKPEDAFGRRDPNSMSAEMRERWYCSPYANSIALQIHEALPDIRVEQIRPVEQNQGKVLSRISGLMLLLTIAALLASALAVSAVMAATIVERRQEIGLMKSLGAGNAAVATLFLTEAGLLALAGALAGFAAGALVARHMGEVIFGSAITVQPVVLAIVVFTALLVAFAGSTGAVRKAMRFDPAVVLRGDA